MASLTRFKAIVSMPSHIHSGHIPRCFAFASAKNKQREKRQWPKDHRHPEPGLGGPAPVARHVIGSRHRGYRQELKDQPGRHGSFRFALHSADRNTKKVPDAGAPRKVRRPGGRILEAVQQRPSVWH
jgi:hypothetical protein